MERSGIVKSGKELGLGAAGLLLITTVMNSVDQNHAGAASGVNNAVSRIAALLAVAAFGALLSSVFQKHWIGR